MDFPSLKLDESIVANRNVGHKSKQNDSADPDGMADYEPSYQELQFT